MLSMLGHMWIDLDELISILRIIRWARHSFPIIRQVQRTEMGS